MLQSVLPKALTDLVKPELAAPIVAFLCSNHEGVPSGKVFEAGAGFYAEWQWRRAEGLFLDITKPITVDDIANNWGTITDMSRASDPVTDDVKIAKQIQKPYELF